MIVTVDSQIKIKNPSQEIKDYCRQELNIKNPEIIKKERMGFWTGNLSKNIKMYSINGDTYVLPLGCIDDVWKITKGCQYCIGIAEHEKLDYPESNIKLYDYQEEAVEFMIKSKRGILESKCRQSVNL